MWTDCFVRATRARPFQARDGLSARDGAARPAGTATPCIAVARNRCAPSQRNNMPYWASQMRVAFSSIAWKTGSSSPGELLMTSSTSAVAVCCASASSRSRVSSASFLSKPVPAEPRRRVTFGALRRLGAVGMLRRFFIATPANAHACRERVCSGRAIQKTEKPQSPHARPQGSRQGIVAAQTRPLEGPGSAFGTGPFGAAADLTDLPIADIRPRAEFASRP